MGKNPFRCPVLLHGCKHFGKCLVNTSGILPGKGNAKSYHSERFLQNFYLSISPAISLATNTPLADAWDREWVTPLPSPIR